MYRAKIEATEFALEWCKDFHPMQFDRVVTALSIALADAYIQGLHDAEDKAKLDQEAAHGHA